MCICAKAKQNCNKIAITADDEIDIIIRGFEECKYLWKNIVTKHEDSISVLNQSNYNLLQMEEAWLIEVQWSFLELEQMKIKHQKKKKQQAKEIYHEQEKTDEERQQLHQQQ